VTCNQIEVATLQFALSFEFIVQLVFRVGVEEGCGKPELGVEGLSSGR
jgi:hypothetical protein